MLCSGITNTTIFSSKLRFFSSSSPTFPSKQRQGILLSFFIFYFLLFTFYFTFVIVFPVLETPITSLWREGGHGGGDGTGREEKKKNKELHSELHLRNKKKRVASQNLAFCGVCCQNSMMTAVYPTPPPVETCKNNQSTFCLSLLKQWDFTKAMLYKSTTLWSIRI